jgi:hypothetical protein
LDTLAKYLPADAVAEIKGWYFEGKTVPKDLVFLGAAHYDAKNAAP